jgi:hypothetical protein
MWQWILRTMACRLLHEQPLVICDLRTAKITPQARPRGLVATHNMDLAARMDRRVTIRDGRVSEMG